MRKLAIVRIASAVLTMALVTSCTTTLIYNGTPAAAWIAPFTVTFYNSTCASPVLCTGSVLRDNPEWVLTAAHCIVNAGVQAGSTAEIGTVYNACGTPYTVSTVTTYPCYAKDDPYGDIALLHLTTAVANPGALPLSLTAAAAGSTVTMVGRGQDSSGGVTGILNSISMTVLDDATCKSSYGPGEFVQNMQCATPASSNGGGLGPGDSGGPVLFKDPNGAWSVVGVACMGGPAYNEPSGFTTIAPYVKWVNSVVAGTPIVPLCPLFPPVTPPPTVAPAAPLPLH